MRPAYGTGALCDVLPSLLTALGARDAAPDEGFAELRDPLGLSGPLAGARRAVLLLVDGLGWHNLPHDLDRTPTLAAIATGSLGAARPITTGFPSTTPTSLVSLGTGATPGEHGVLGFTVAVPETGAVLVHTMWPGEPDPMAWQPKPVLLGEAYRWGINTAIVNQPEFETSNLTRVSTGTDGFRPATGAMVVAEEVLAALAAMEGPSVVYAYHSALDQAGHAYGCASPQWWQAAEELDAALARIVEGLVYGTALIITADHGQLDVPPDRRIDVDADPRLLEGLTHVVGEPRVRYLHTRPGAADDVAAAWRAVLGPVATVLTRDEAIDEGLFGPVPDAHRARIGDVVAICADDWALIASAHEPARVGQLIAYHGALTPTEMTIPLITIGE